MGSMLDALKQLEAGAPTLPVILPLGGARDEEEKTPPDCGPGGREQIAERFEFPELSKPCQESSVMEAPKAIWPECDCTETAQACVKVAKGIYRRLLSNRPTILAISSPGDGDGKTSLLIALAPELVKRTADGVLVVDADFHKPDLTSKLTFSPSRRPDGPSLIYPTNLSGLNVLPTPSKLRSRGVDPYWIERLREGWPLVLVDTASLEHEEVAPIMQRCDGVYLVVRLGHTARRAVTEAAHVIRNRGGRLLGCVVVG